MKRSELKVGEAYYWAPGNDWARPTYGNGRGEKAVVVALWASSGSRGWRSAAHEVPEGTPGAGVLVKVGTWTRVVPTNQLRGSYQETADMVAKYVRRRDQESAEYDRRREAERRARDQELARAKRLGLQGCGAGTTTVNVPVDTFRELLDAYEKERDPDA